MYPDQIRIVCRTCSASVFLIKCSVSSNDLDFFGSGGSSDTPDLTDPAVRVDYYLKGIVAQAIEERLAQDDLRNTRITRSTMYIIKDDVINMHADTLCSPSVFERMINENADIVLPVDYKICDEEAMKVKTIDNKNLKTLI